MDLRTRPKSHRADKDPAEGLFDRIVPVIAALGVAGGMAYLVINLIVIIRMLLGDFPR